MTMSSSRPSRHALATPENGSLVAEALGVLRFLDAHDVQVAPMVAARLAHTLGADEHAVLQTAVALTQAQRRGIEALPDPLPLVDQVESAVGDASLADWEFETLLAAAVCVHDRTDVLIEFAERTISELIAGGLSRHLRLVAGHFALADPRMRVWVHGSASLAQRTAVHERLSTIYLRRGDVQLATWHRALSTLEGDPALVLPLLALAHTTLVAGDAERAYRIAREATSHADTPEQMHRAAVLAALAAVACGFAEDAVRMVEPALGTGDPLLRFDALALHLLATNWLTGVVADGELEGLLAHLDPGVDSAQAARACALVATLLAERGEHTAAEQWQQRAARRPEHRVMAEAAGAWCSLHAGALDKAPEPAPLLGELAAALRLGLRGTRSPRCAAWCTGSAPLLPHRTK